MAAPSLFKKRSIPFGVGRWAPWYRAFYRGEEMKSELLLQHP